MMTILSTATDTSTAAADSPAGGIIVFAVISVLLWFGLFKYVAPAVRSQAGRAERMSRYQRIQRIGFASFMVLYPLMMTAALAMVLAGTGNAPMWLASALMWGTVALPCIAVALLLLAFIFRCIERHQARVTRRELGLPDPRPPWWPVGVVAIWSIGVLTAFAAASYVMWVIIINNVEDRANALEATVRAASLDPSVQQLAAANASRAVITAKLDQLTNGARTELSEITQNLTGIGIGNFIALLVVLAIIGIGGFLLYRRQQRRRRDYEARMTETVSRAAALAL